MSLALLFLKGWHLGVIMFRSNESSPLLSVDCHYELLDLLDYPK